MELSGFQSDADNTPTDQPVAPVDMLISSLQIFFDRLSDEYNRTIGEEPLIVTVRRIELLEPPIIARLLVASSVWVLSIRVRHNLSEFFILPSTERAVLTESELPSRLKLTLELAQSTPKFWTINGTAVTSDELNALMRGLFKDLIVRSRQDYEKLPDAARIVSSTQSFVGSVRSLVADNHSLLQKIVSQQEAIQNQIARELHDSVLGNLMLLRRTLSTTSKKRMSELEMIELLDDVSSRLREISQELSPRDLLDCGLRPMLEELCRHLARYGCTYSFHCPEELPALSDEVNLHLYRIAQEGFNNVLKHSGATEVTLWIELEGDLLRMRIADNGVGFDTSIKPGQRTTYGGTGTGIIRERTELINCVYPARVWLDSQHGDGTTITLELKYRTTPSN